MWRGTLDVRLMFAVLALSIDAMAQGQPAPPAASQLPAAAELAAAFDRAFAPDGRHRYTGAVVTVVENGRIVFSKGYGFRDADHRQPVDPAITRFRLGSITKTLVATGVGKLVEDGVITSLDVPANGLLKRYQLPANRGSEITLRMLGTHQAGLAEGRMPFMRPGDVMPKIDAAYLEANFPGYLVPVNGGSNYSNLGASLLGYIVEDQTGQSFQTFAATRIFAPLGMTRTLIAQDARPIDGLAQSEALYPNGGRLRIPDGWANHPINMPAGGVVSTGHDMGRYMIGLLGGGEGVPALLSPAAQRVVMARQGGTHKLTQGYGVLFMINDWNGDRIIEHGGRTLGASSYMTLVPGRRTGIFVAVTGDYGTALPATALLGLPALPAPDPPQADKTLPGLSNIRAFGLEAVLGRARMPVTPQAASRFDAADYAGQYVGQRRSISSVTQVFSDTFLGGPLTISAGPPGQLLLGRTPYVAVAPDVFWHDPALTPDRPSGWSDLMVFRRWPDGRVKDMSLQYTDVVFERATGPITPARAGWLLASGALIVMTGLFALVWAKGSRGRGMALVTALAVLASPLVFFRSWPEAAVESLSFVWITPADLIPFQLWLNAAALLAAGMIFIAIAGIVRPRPVPGWRGAVGRWHGRAIAIGAVLMLVGFGYYGMIGWNTS